MVIYLQYVCQHMPTYGKYGGTSYVPVLGEGNVRGSKCPGEYVRGKCPTLRNRNPNPNVAWSGLPPISNGYFRGP